ncbi:hypothetical protein L2E82_51691 [Cichorium intybus]|nr:hypothetical protein L2E82_51691 [Cichorium intybus]
MITNRNSKSDETSKYWCRSHLLYSQDDDDAGTGGGLWIIQGQNDKNGVRLAWGRVGGPFRQAKDGAVDSDTGGHHFRFSPQNKPSFHSNVKTLNKCMLHLSLIHSLTSIRYSSLSLTTIFVLLRLMVSLKTKLMSLKMKKSVASDDSSWNNYDKIEKSESMRIEIRSKKARRLIEETLKVADSPKTTKSYSF